ncbi:helix-turn-helix domain-containing protein [Shinella curvata]|uniref:Helix-turn-helix domain-containing protein n=2 Tax=Shinella curvata TaxID=1817964 RepID=A0ABT8XMC1_9HYPH|nr:helix-turn-helix domain-containing protein [Shinella curvata]MDO6124889.1 helix-turn-helix domain-containing protein [Shinella curvata]
MSLTTLAAITGLTPSFLSQFERGKCGANETTIARLCNGLGLSYSNSNNGPPLQHRVVRNYEQCAIQAKDDLWILPLKRSSSADIQVDMIAVQAGARTLVKVANPRHVLRYLIVLNGRIQILSDREYVSLDEGDTFECQITSTVEVSTRDERQASLCCISS